MTAQLQQQVPDFSYERGLELLKKANEDLSLAQLSARLGYSKAALSLVLRGKYQPDQGGRRLLQAVIIEFGGNVDCPVLGEISQQECGDYAKRPFQATNPQRVQLYRACQQCPNKRNC